MKSRLAWWGLVLAVVGCGGQRDGADTVLVEVGDRDITASALAQFVQGLPENLRTKKSGTEAKREYLQSLVDRQIMVTEAGKRGIGELPGLIRVLSELTAQRLAERRSAELIDARVSISEQDLKDTYQRLGVGWEIWPAHILSATEAEAREVIRQLRAGDDFSELARRRSRAPDAAKGGNLGGFFAQDDAVPALREATFGKPVGFISEPVHTRDGWEVVKVLDRREVPFEKVREAITSRLRQQRWVERQIQAITELSKEFQVQFHRERLTDLLRARAGQTLSAEEATAPLVSFRGGQVSVGACAEILKKNRRSNAVRDTLTATRFVEREVLADTLMLLSARNAGLDRDPELLTWQARKREELLVSQLRMDEVIHQVEVTEAEARAFYDAHIADYTSVPGPIQLTEVIVETRQEADEVLKAAQSGERLERLAVKHSVRPRMEPVNGHAVGDSGRMVVDTLISSPYRDFFGDNNTEAVGRIQGPLKVQDRYSVFRLDKPVALVPFTFEQARVRVIRRIRNEREAARFTVFLDSLRTVYQPQVRWHEDRIARLAAQTATAN